jgi:hypothetical protein
MTQVAIKLAALDQSNKAKYLAYATMHFNKSIAFVTGTGLHGDGSKCTAYSLPESYNAIIDKND